MSRSGTLQDALRFVDEFQRAAAPSSRVQQSAAALTQTHEDAEDIKDGDSGERRHGRRRRRHEELDDDARRKGKHDKDRHKRRRKKVNRTRDKYDKEDSNEDDSHDDHAAKEKRRRDRKKKGGREHRKKERKSSSRRVERKGEEENRRKTEKGKKKQQQRSPENDSSSSSEDEDSNSGSNSSESQSPNSALRAEQVVADIVGEFPEVEDDLHQLLQRVDSGKAVDISGLPNKRLVSLLRDLFKSLKLKKSLAGVYLLPSGCRPTLDCLGAASSKSDQKGHAKDETIVPLPEIGPPNNPANPNCRVLGPAMPSAEMLEAAAKLTEAEEALRDMQATLEDDPMIGPPPPAAVAEASSANDAERYEEVTRIMASDVVDAYELLGLKQGVDAGHLKKRYWKLSLLVHPDKCQHPQAQQAFMALNKAFKDLQDPLKRSEIDRKANAKAAKEEYEEDMRARREAAQWRKLRGEEALPGDAQLLQGEAKDPGRDEWMTVLPPERQAGGPPSQQNTFFSRSQKSGRGDTSAWTDTPLEKAERAKMQYLEAYKQATLAAPESSFEKDKAAKAATLMDQYNQRKRPVSLLEEHQQKSVKELKNAKKVKIRQQEEKKKEWAEAHPWKPWDREKDLTAGRQTMKWDDKKSSGEALRSRFGSSGHRSFL